MKFLLLILIVIAGGIPVPCFAQISFSPYINYPTGSFANVVCIGDVNNDGLKDVVLGTGFYFDQVNDYSIFVYLQDAQGNLMAPVKYRYPDSYPGITSMSLGDINNDGLNDVVIGYDMLVGIFQQDVNGLLGPIQLYNWFNQNSYVDGVSINDLNNDGLNDIAVSQWGGPFITIMKQNNGGGFTPESYAAPAGGYDEIETGDLNGDQRNDAAFMLGQMSGGISLYYQNTDGTMQNAVDIDVGGHVFLGGFDIGDLNNDGYNDIARAISGNSPDAKLSMFFQDAVTHTMAGPVLLPAYDCAEPLEIADLNCDGRNEVIMAHGGWMNLSVYEQNSSNVYAGYQLFPLPYASHYKPQGLSIGDINNDKRPDVAIADYNQGLVLLYNQSGNKGTLLKPAIPEGQRQICHDESTVRYSTFHPAAEGFVWHLDPAGAGILSATGSDTCAITWNEEWRGIAKIFVEAYNDCGAGVSDTLRVTVDRLPVLSLGHDTLVCAGSTLLLSAGQDFETLAWQDNTHSTTYTVTRGGTYSVEATHACGTVADTVVVSEIPLPIIRLVSDTVLCTGTQLSLDVSLPGTYSYRWQDNNASPVYRVSQPGIYAVSVSDTNQCTAEKSVIVTSLTAPVLKWPQDTLLCTDVPFTLNAAHQSAVYLWQDGSDRSYFNVTSPGQYSVAVTNPCGYTEAAIQVAMEECTSYLDVPSAFSPNGDGLNDILYAVGTNVDQVHFVIYSRWGQKVFESNDLLHGWDGAMNGTELDPAVFVYLITARSTVNGHSLHKEGNITLIR